MKTIIALLSITLILSSCVTDKNLLTNVERLDWSNKNDTILYKQKPIAVFTHYEVELYKGETSREICLEALDIDTIDVEPLIIKYVHTVHPDDKIQFIPKYKR